MSDKRRYQRFTLNELEVSGRMISAAEVKVVDISVSGISLKTNRMLNIGRGYAVKVEGKTVLSLKGVVVWCSLIGSRKISSEEMMPIYSAGLQFTAMSSEKTAELMSFIENHKIGEIHVPGGTRLNVRFHIEEPEKAVLNLTDGYEVKLISLGGMLIECGQDVEIESLIPMELFIRDDRSLRFIGRVASRQVVDGDDQNKYRLGIEFLDLTKKDREVLSSFIFGDLQ